MPAKWRCLDDLLQTSAFHSKPRPCGRRRAAKYGNAGATQGVAQGKSEHQKQDARFLGLSSYAEEPCRHRSSGLPQSWRSVLPAAQSILKVGQAFSLSGTGLRPVLAAPASSSYPSDNLRQHCCSLMAAIHFLRPYALSILWHVQRRSRSFLRRMRCVPPSAGSYRHAPSIGGGVVRVGYWHFRRPPLAASPLELSAATGLVHTSVAS